MIRPLKCVTAALAFAVCSFSLTPVAMANERILVRHKVPFSACPGVISTVLDKIRADRNNVQTVRDTGAHYFVELEAINANIQFRCNAVTEVLEVYQIVPGTLKFVFAE